jgi:hypothetical protein
MDQLKSAILTILIGLVAAGLVPMLHLGIQALKQKVDALKLGKWNSVADLAFDELDTAVTKLQPLADDMKKKATDGKLDDAQIAELKRQAIAFAHDNLLPVGIDVAKQIPATLLEGWVTHLVEARRDPGITASVGGAAAVLAQPVKTPATVAAK